METNKRGLLSNFIIFFGATILIVLILIVYIVAGGIIKKLDNKNHAAEVGIYDEEKVELDNIFDYSDRFILLNDAKFLVAEGESVEEALQRMEEILNAEKQKDE
ncbi:hypothetical protein K8R30_03280 [archaeon]|nr:hypothetical protein [archaeon]